MSNPAILWTAEQTEELKRLYGEGLSCSAIAAVMGKSRNAVIGRAHRIGLERRGAGKRAEIEAERIRAQMKLEHDSQIQGLKAELDLLKHRDQMQLEWARLGQRSQQAQQDAFQPGSVIDAQ